MVPLRSLVRPVRLGVCVSLIALWAVALPSLVRAEGPGVILAEAQSAQFVDRVEALGTLRANETVRITATVAEKVTAVRFDDGQRVEAGAILIEMTSGEEAALLEEAVSTEAEAKRQFRRISQLAQEGTASRSLLDTRRREWETAKARLAAIQSRLEDRIILAPFAGVVGLRTISVGALVTPGELITTLHDDSKMKLDFAVPATFLTTLKVGLKIEARADALGGQVFSGTVASIDNEIDPVTRSIRIRAILPNEDKALKPGLLMTVELLKNPRDALVIPEEALVPLGAKIFVYVVDPTSQTPTATRQEVVRGARRPGEVEILSGLEPGQFVITHGTQKAKPGKPVTIQGTQTDEGSIARILSGKSGG
ncbi:MAG: efflux RND transporter periplasmic adaptor subunit [Pseudomonadota bacterium]